ncbi:hypothetical protein V8F06_009103 [Rhypophila decipiens]
MGAEQPQDGLVAEAYKIESNWMNVNSDSKSAPSVPPSRTPPREMERCRRCGYHYMTAQLNNPRVNTKCGLHHTGEITTRREMLAKEGKGLSANFTLAYLDKQVYSCCLAVYPSTATTSYCARYDGNHEPGGK